LADVNSNININFNTAAALAQLRSLQAGLSKFHQTLAEGNLAAANAQKGLNAQLLQSIGATGKFSASQVKVAGSTLAFTSALEKNKLSLREYYRYTMAAATANTRVMGKAFAQEREILNRARRDRVKALQAQYIQMNKANAGFMDAIRIMPKNLQMAGGRFTELGTRIQYAAQRQQFLNQLLKQGSTQLLNFGKNTQWAGRQLMVGLTMPLALFGSSAAKTFRELETEIVKFKRVYGDALTNDSETNAAVENIRKLATEYTKYGVSVTKTMEMAGTAAAAGFQGAALNAQVETATKLAVLGQVEQQQALETTISLQNAFGLSSEELAKKIDFLNAVENQTVLSIEDLTVAIPKAAPVIKQLGGNVEDLAFFMTAMKEGGINASEGANALKSGLASLINPSKKAAGFLADLGINVKSIVESNQGDIKATVIGFSQALDTLDPLNRARAIEQMFGKFQFARLSTLFQNVAKDGTQASRALGLAGSSVEELAILSEREMKKIEDSIGVKFQAAVERFKQDIMPLGKIFLEALTPIVEFFGKMFEKFNGLGDNTKKVIAVIVGAVAGLGPILLMTFGLLANGVANIIKFFAMLRGGIAKLNGQTSILGGGFNYVTQEQIENMASSQQLHQTHTRLIEVFNMEKTSVNALAASYNSLSTQMRTMASQNPSLFAGGAPGAKRAVNNLPPARKYKDGVLSVPGPKGAGDVVPAMLSPGEAVIPTDTTNKYRGLISAMFQDKVPGFMAGRLPGGPGRGIPLSAGPAAFRDAQQAKYRRISDARQGYSEPHPEKKSGPVFVGMPKSGDQTSQSRQIVDKIAQQVSMGRFGTLPPSNFGTLLQPFSGRSFPVPGVGGIYRKPNGKIVVVKPTIDEKTALAEVRATDIAREVHGLVAPKQSIRTMIDPTDPSGQRKFIVVESPYDPRISAMDGKFSKSDMVKQLVASTLRGDKDLQKPNLSGNVLADVGTAGVFDRASGFRDFSKAMPSMEQQAVVNLLGVKGGAKKFFAQETSGIASKMSPAEYDQAIKSEINKSIPRLEKLLKTWDLEADEQVVYNNMLKRLKDGAKTDWDKLQPVHARAGEGVKKAIEGIDPKATNSMVEEQIRKYALPSGTQEQLLLDDLKRGVQNDFAEKLNTIDPQRAAVIRAAWAGGKANVPPSGKQKAFSAPRQTAFLDEISKMHPINVNGETKYVHQDDLNAFKADPDGRAKYARSAQEVKNMMLYRMGVIPDEKGRLVSGGKFTGRFGAVDHFATSLRSTGKESGGFAGNVKKEFRKTLVDAQGTYNKQIKNDPRMIKMMTDAGLTPAEARAELSAELSHISKTGEKGRGNAKWLKGTGLFDSKIVNRYMNSSERLAQQLEWNKANGYQLIPKGEVAKYYEAAAFMKTGRHPSNSREAGLLALAIDADKKALANPRIPYKTDQSLAKMNALGSLIQDRVGGASSGFYDKASKYNFGAGNLRGLVLAKLGEYVYDKPKKTLEKIGNNNSKAAPSNVKASTGKASDNRLVSEGAGRSVVTKAQAGRLAGGRGGVAILPGRADGDPNAKVDRRILNPSTRQGDAAADLRRRGYSQNEIDRVLRKIAKDEARLARNKSESVRQQTAEQRTQDAERRRQTNEARSRFKEQQRLSQLNYNQSVNYQDALDEDNQRKLNNLKQSRKDEIKQRRNLRAEKVGRFSGGASMALGTAGMGLMMAGNEKGGMAAMGASALAGMAPMLTNPISAVATGLIALGASVYAFNLSMKKAREEGVALANSMSMTSKKLVELSEITKTVSATEEADKKRADRLIGATEKQRKVGQTILESEFGKSLLGDIQTQSKAGRSSTDIGQNVGVQLSSAMLSGVINSEQARTLAMAIGNQLQDYPLSANIVGEIIQITGPNGENLKNDPLQVALDIDKKTFKSSSKMIDIAGGQSLSKSLADVQGSKDRSILDKTLGVLSLGIVPAYFDIRDAAAKTNKIKTAGAQLMIQELQNNQQLVDSLNKQYDLKLKSAKTEKEVAEIEKQRKSALEKLNQQNKQQMALVLKSKDKLGDAAFSAAVKGAADLLYKEGPVAELKNVALDQLNALDNSSFKTQMQLEFASGLVDPATMIELLGNKELQKQYNLLVTTTLKGNAAEAAIISQLLSKAGVNVETKTIVLSLLNNQGDRFSDEDITNAIDTLSTIQETYGITLDVNVNGEEKVKRIADMSNALKGRKSVTKVELQAMAQEDPRYKYIVDNWATLVGDGSTITRTMLLKIETLVTDDKVLDAYLQAAGTPSERATAASVRQGTIPDVAMNSIRQNASVYFAANPSKLSGALGLGDSKSGEGGGTKENPLAFLDSLAVRLKQVRDNAFNALKPVDSLLAAFRDKKTQQGAFKLFDGIQNRLLKMGAGKDFRDAIASMSAEDFSKVAALKGKDALFTFAKGKAKTKDNITGLTETGKAVDQGYREANLGDFNLVNEETVQAIQDQDKAYKMLIGSGVSAADALEIVADRSQAAALAGGAIKTTDPEWKKYIANIKEANSSLERQAVLNRAIKANEEFKMYTEMPKLVSQMQSLGYSTDQIDAVLGDPQLAKFLVEDLKDGKLDAKAIAEYLNNIEAKKIIDIQVALNQGDLSKAAAEGREIVDDLFAAQEGLIRTGPEAMQLKANEREIRDLDAQIAPFRRQIEGLNDQIEDGQREIEKSYTRPIEVLNEEVNDLSRELEMNPLFGDRAIKKIQDENNMLSNDLEIINKAADEVNKKYDEQAEALSKVQEINQNILEQQQQQLGLADALTQGDISAAAQAAQGIRATSASQFAAGQSDALEQARKNALGALVGPESGLTSEQINEKQFQNSQRIYQMETDPRRLEILNQIQSKQDEIYALEEKREAALLRIRDLEDQIYDIEENSIEPLQERIDALNYTNRILQDSIDKQIEGLTVLGKTRDEWNRINAQLDAQAASLRAANGSAALAGLLSAAEALNLTWAEILAKLAAYGSGVPASVGNAVNLIGGAGSDAYVAPQDTPESAAALEEFIGVVNELDSAQAALDEAYDKGEWAKFSELQRRLAAAQEAYNATLPTGDVTGGSGGPGGRFAMQYASMGGLIKPKYFGMGGFARGTDTVPAMLTPGEFIMSKYAVQSHGIDKMRSINNGSSAGDSVYNYSISVNVKSDANPDEIARVVMTQIKGIDSQKLRGNRF
jgi:TP901 family phage tail tape measure protein